MFYSQIVSQSNYNSLKDQYAFVIDHYWVLTSEGTDYLDSDYFSLLLYFKGRASPNCALCLELWS